MPSEGPGQRYVAVATKATTHAAPAVELKHAGIAAKSEQIAAMAPNLANAALAVQIPIGEHFVIMLSGVHTIESSLLPGGAAAGDQLWIDSADNTLKSAAGAGRIKFGLLDSIDTTLGRAEVNLTQRSSF